MIDGLHLRARQPGDAASCEAILRSLPAWFGIEESILGYRRDIEVMDTWVAVRDEAILGFITVTMRSEYSGEIQVMAVQRSAHRRGLGRELVTHAERILAARGVTFLQVKTLGPSRPNAEYEATRRFYVALGYRPLEETNLWGDVNPCLIMVKHLSCSG